MENRELEPLKFGNEFKLRRQMRKRKITESMVREALTSVPQAWHGKLGSAKLYRSETSGIVVIVDDSNGAIFHIGAAGYKYDDR